MRGTNIGIGGDVNDGGCGWELVREGGTRSTPYFIIWYTLERVLPTITTFEYPSGLYRRTRRVPARDRNRRTISGRIPNVQS